MFDMLSDGTADVRCLREKSAVAVQHNMPLRVQPKRKRMVTRRTRRCSSGESQGGRMEKAVTGGEKAYLEGDEGGYAGVFFKRWASRCEPRI